ncbi:MAG: AraC family transcriptional regulator [Cytophagaceae bacterium]
MNKNEGLKAGFILSVFISFPLLANLSNLFVLCLNNVDLAYTQVLTSSINYMVGPTILFYVNEILWKKPLSYYKWHFIVSSVAVLYSTTYLFLNDDEKNIIYHAIVNGTYIPFIILNILSFFHVLFYVIIVKISIAKTDQPKNDGNNYYLMLRKKWANSFTNYIILLDAILIITYTILIVFFDVSSALCDLIMLPGITLALYTFIVIKNFQFAKITHQVESDHGLRPKAKQKNTGHTAQHASIVKEIENYFSDSKTFTDPNLSIRKMAEELDISVNILSSTINEQYEVNFSTFINNYRTNYAKELLQSPDFEHLKLEAIGEKAGFSSRSTFFATFKKNTGLSPAEFKNSTNKPTTLP